MRNTVIREDAGGITEEIINSINDVAPTVVISRMKSENRNNYVRCEPFIMLSSAWDIQRYEAGEHRDPCSGRL